MCMRHIVICGLPSLQYFSTLSHKRLDFLTKKLLNIECVSWFSLHLLFEIVLILRRNERDMIKNVHWSSRKVPIIPVILWWNLTFLGSFSKKNANNKFHKNPSSETRVQCGQKDGRTDMTKLIATFCDFGTCLKNWHDLKHASKRQGMLRSFYLEKRRKEILRDTNMKIGDSIERKGGKTSAFVWLTIGLGSRLSACYCLSFQMYSCFT
jgi:hypothetical protein